MDSDIFEFHTDSYVVDSGNIVRACVGINISLGIYEVFLFHPVTNMPIVRNKETLTIIKYSEDLKIIPKKEFFNASDRDS